MAKKDFAIVLSEGAVPFTVSVNVPDTMAEAIEMYSESTAFDLIMRAVKQQINAASKRLSVDKKDKDGNVVATAKNPAEISVWFETWKPNQNTRTRKVVDPVAEFEKMFNEMANLIGADKRDALLKQLRQKAAQTA